MAAQGIRKRCTYGTIVADLERRRALDLLQDRTAETLGERLRRLPGIEAVARDRSTEYARGIALGAPAPGEGDQQRARPRGERERHHRLLEQPGPHAAAV